jgi:hypothetical protein
MPQASTYDTVRVSIKHGVSLTESGEMFPFFSTCTAYHVCITSSKHVSASLA